MLLKRLAESGYTLFEIGSLLSRSFVGGDEEPSELERVCDEARRAFMEDIAEGDEGSEGVSQEEDEDDFDVDEDDEVKMLPLNFTSLSVNAPRPNATGADAQGSLWKPPMEATYGSSKDEEGMMFDIDVGGDTLRTPGLSPSAYPNQHGFSPSQHSISSMSSSSPFSPQSYPIGNENKNVARSVSSTSFVWRTSVRTGRKKRTPQAYPPILPGKSPCVGSGTSTSAMSFSDFSEIQWQRFMLQFELLLNQGVKMGEWRQVSDNAGVIAMSCPQ